MRVILSPGAAVDLEEIGDYIASENPAAADRMIDAIRERCSRLGNTPGIGVGRPELKQGLHSVPFRRYLIFYTVIDSGLRIERIIHGARDLGAVFDDEA